MTNKNKQKLPKIAIKPVSDSQAIFTLSPLPRGLGATLGNSIRRMLLSFIEGYAITSVRFRPNVSHEFASIEGIREDVQEIILRLKKVRLKKIKDVEEEKILVLLKGSNAFKVSDITKSSSSFEGVNPNQVIFHMSDKVNLDVELTIGKGTGYVSAEENKPEKQVLGLFAIDAIYSPVHNVKIHVEDMLVDRKTNYEKLVLEVLTDGSILPETALRKAAKMLRDSFDSLTNDTIETTPQQGEKVTNIENDKSRINELLVTPLSKLKLSARVINSLNANGIEYLKDIMGKKVGDLLLLPNFGKKCLQDLENFLAREKISLGGTYCK